ncbi:hypothetical protein TNCV_2821231 [Trichonephila clavipes]|nr:hypothetical protein TNCV_2821231 [Trichonephila clavipes]
MKRANGRQRSLRICPETRRKLIAPLARYCRDRKNSVNPSSQHRLPERSRNQRSLFGHAEPIPRRNITRSLLTGGNPRSMSVNASQGGDHFDPRSALRSVFASARDFSTRPGPLHEESETRQSAVSPHLTSELHEFSVSNGGNLLKLSGLISGKNEPGKEGNYKRQRKPKPTQQELQQPPHQPTPPPVRAARPSSTTPHQRVQPLQAFPLPTSECSSSPRPRPTPTPSTQAINSTHLQPTFNHRRNTSSSCVSLGCRNISRSTAGNLGQISSRFLNRPQCIIVGDFNAKHTSGVQPLTTTQQAILSFVLFELMASYSQPLTDPQEFIPAAGPPPSTLESPVGSTISRPKSTRTCLVTTTPVTLSFRSILQFPSSKTARPSQLV